MATQARCLRGQGILLNMDPLFRISYDEISGSGTLTNFDILSSLNMCRLKGGRWRNFSLLLFFLLVRNFKSQN